MTSISSIVVPPSLVPIPAPAVIVTTLPVMLAVSPVSTSITAPPVAVSVTSPVVVTVASSMSSAAVMVIAPEPVEYTVPLTIVRLPVRAVTEIVPEPVVVTSCWLCSTVPPTSSMSPPDVEVIAWFTVSW